MNNDLGFFHLLLCCDNLFITLEFRNAVAWQYKKYIYYLDYDTKLDREYWLGQVSSKQ